jgi:Asp-tRNA(Asn)/Glu-tRNA(Gln) amidotransferase A subunit family amidase
VDDGLLLARAKALDQLPDRERDELALLGLPVGVKDNFDTAGLPTSYGSPIYAGHRPRVDAAVVARLHAAGAMIAGKTKLAEFAWMHPSDTLNPLDPTRTPGGSSSGSAAAVAAGTVPVATGTQTAGSVNRPASYCGVVGYKATFGLLPTDGIKLMSPALDTVGLVARTVADTVLVCEALLGWTRAAGMPAAPRLGFARTPIWDRVTPDAAAAIERGVADRGRVEEIDLPAGFEELIDAQTTVQSYESARSLAHELATNPELLSDELREALGAGAAIPADVYGRALETRERHGPPLVEVLERFDGMLTPSTTGVPPIGLDHTGDPVFSRAWNYLGAPCVSLPLVTTGGGLPVGLQLVGAPGSDRRLLAAAAWLLGDRHGSGTG